VRSEGEEQRAAEFRTASEDSRDRWSLICNKNTNDYLHISKNYLERKWFSTGKH